MEYKIEQRIVAIKRMWLLKRGPSDGRAKGETTKGISSLRPLPSRS